MVGWLIGVLFYGVSTLFGLFNAELSHFSLIWFYGISTIVGYLMPNPFIYINIYIYIYIYIYINSSISNNSVLHKYSLNFKAVLFHTIQ